MVFQVLTFPHIPGFRGTVTQRMGGLVVTLRGPDGGGSATFAKMCGMMKCMYPDKKGSVCPSRVHMTVKDMCAFTLVTNINDVVNAFMLTSTDHAHCLLQVTPL